MKLFVHRRARGRGLARTLMVELESTARKLGRTLLLMDTRLGGEAEEMCGCANPWVTHGMEKFLVMPAVGMADCTPLCSFTGNWRNDLFE